MIVPKEFGVKPDSKPPKWFGGLADELLARLWDIMECYGSAANPHAICGASEVHALSLDSIKSKVESGEMARTEGALAGPTAR